MGEGLRILVISREFPPRVLGGMSYHLGNLYGRIRSNGASVTVLAGTCDEVTLDTTVPRPDDVNVEWIPFGSRRGHHIRFPIALKRHLWRFDTTPYDVAFTHTPVPFELDLPTVGKYHDCAREEKRYQSGTASLFRRSLDRLIDPTRHWVDQRSLNAVDTAIFNSNLMRRTWGRHYDLPERSVVHYNGVDTEVFHPHSSVDGDYLLFVGNSERKGLSTVLEFAGTSTYPVRLVGPKDVEDENVRAVGRVSQRELARLYSGALATIHPAKFEAFGNVVLESLACGTPVVTTKTCGASELLDDRCGVVSDDLSEGITRLSDRGADTDACVEVARTYSWDRVARRTLDLAREVAW